MDEVHRRQSRVGGDIPVVVLVEIIPFTPDIKTVLHQVEPVFPGRFALDEQLEPVEAPDRFEPVERACRFGDTVELFPDELGVGGFQPVQFHGIAVRAVLIELDAGLEVFQILADTPYQVVVLLYLFRDLLQLVAAR